MFLTTELTTFDTVIMPLIILGLIVGLIALIPILIIRKAKKKKRQKMVWNEQGIIIKDTFVHVSGLPLADGIEVTISVFEDKVEFEGSGTQITLARSRITDVSIKNETEIQTHFTSSIGGAVAGGVLFGPLGAIIGGRSKKKQTAQISSYLIFTYKKEDSVEYIAFDVTTSWTATKFPKQFQGIEKAQITL